MVLESQAVNMKRTARRYEVEESVKVISESMWDYGYDDSWFL